jgi:magnesium chelatase family protein
MAEYQARISGPFLDRVDLVIEVPAVSAADLALPPPREGSRAVAERVTAARAHAATRFAALGRPDLRVVAAAEGPVLDTLAAPDDAGRRLLADAADKLRLSARAYHRVLRVARTIADLDGAETVGRPHLAEALSYRGEARREAA